MMLSSMLVVAAFTAGPVDYDGGYVGAVGAYGSFDAYGFGGQLYPYDAPEPWLHGYYQEIPAYGGYAAFRPYNYKHVLSQSQAAGGWGLNPTMPYSQQFWHRYHAAATMSPGVETYDAPIHGHAIPHRSGLHPTMGPVTPIDHLNHRSAPSDERTDDEERLRRAFR